MRIQGFESYEVSSDGQVTNTRTGRVLKFDLTGMGYPRVTLSENNKLKRYTVHRLVALHYLPNPNQWDMVNHKNGIKEDNRVENLEWCTCKHNTIHAFNNNLRKSGEDAYNTFVSNQLIEDVCVEIQKGLKRMEILSQDRFKEVSKHMFDDLRRRKTWKRISYKYKW